MRVFVDKKYFAVARDLFATEIRVEKIASGKLRRYANLNFFYRWFSLYHLRKTHLPNLLDCFRIVAGFFQSFFKLIFWRPNVIFLKGGFVCLPVGIAARILRIPTVIHDSDAVPGLTSRILAKSAKLICTGSPLENYPSYQKQKTRYVGIPVRDSFRQLSLTEKKLAKKKFELDPTKKLVLVIGGGGGSQILNDAVIAGSGEILAKNAQIFILAGKNASPETLEKSHRNLIICPFVSRDIEKLIGAADVVITRAGATSLAELAAVAAPVIIVPSPFLAGDHQTKNAMNYAKNHAGIVLSQQKISEHPGILTKKILRILADKKLAKKLGENLHKFYVKNSAQKMAEFILEVARK